MIQIKCVCLHRHDLYDSSVLVIKTAIEDSNCATGSHNTRLFTLKLLVDIIFLVETWHDVDCVSFKVYASMDITSFIDLGLEYMKAWKPISAAWRL